MNWYSKVIRNYAVFTGRARRKEYWMFVLFNYIFTIAAFILDIVFRWGPIFLVLYSLFVLVPSLAVGARRMHDQGKSGWWLLISLVPLIGGIWLLVLLCTDSQPGANQYGPNPKEEPAPAMAA